EIHLLDICVFDEKRISSLLPTACAHGTRFNLIASGSLLEKLARDDPELHAELRQRVAAEAVEVCGGIYAEREDAVLPLESELWNLKKGLAVSRELLGSDVRVFARQRTAFHPHLPLLLT